MFLKHAEGDMNTITENIWIGFFKSPCVLCAQSYLPSVGEWQAPRAFAVSILAGLF